MIRRTTNYAPILVTLLAVLSLAGCGSFSKSIVTEPVSAKPAPIAVATATNGAIYQSVSYRPLFEDKRARHVGDTLIVQISENISASGKSASQAERTGTVSASVPTIQGLPGKSFQGAGLDANSSNKFSGKGENSSANVFTGTIAVTVVDELPQREFDRRGREANRTGAGRGKNPLLGRGQPHQHRRGEYRAVEPDCRCAD